MAFVDEARIQVKAGGGGKGCESHYMDKYMRHPRPDGGDGGDGGDVVIVANRNFQTLLDYRFKQHYQAERGGHASSKGKGKTGADAILPVPLGTIVWDDESGFMIRDLSQDRDSVIVAKGGKGGLGNMRRKFTVPPTDGEAKVVRLELKIIADVGLVGFPNAGKSTLISSVSKVRSKIANYPFTTKQPVLGIVRGDDGDDFVMADLPGLIEGAHLGKGLGHQFLKHVERTKILVHVVDMSGSDMRAPYDDYKTINEELALYSDAVSHKHKILVANKMDLPEAKENFKKFKRRCKEKIFPVSALEKEGLDELIKEIRKILCRVNPPN